MLEEIVESAKSQFVERLASPLIGSFAVSWCLWNYKFLVIVFSSAGVTQTFKLIETIVFPDMLTMLFKGLGLPLASAFLYLFVYPYPARWIYEITRKHAQAMDEIRKKYDDQELMPMEKARKLRAEIVIAEENHKKEIDRLTQEVDDLKSIQGELAAKHVGLNETQRLEVAAMQPDSMIAAPDGSWLSNRMLNVLKLFGGEADRITERAAIDGSKLSTVEAKFVLGELVEHGLLTSPSSTASGSMYQLTQNGRRVLLSL